MGSTPDDEFKIMVKIVLYSSILGLAIAGFMMNAAWQHNAQGEIHIDGVIDWGYWLLIGFSWFLPVFVVSCLASMLFLQPWKRKS